MCFCASFEKRVGGGWMRASCGRGKGGRSPAQRTLDGDHGTRQSSLAECRHGAAFSNGSKRLWMQNQLFEAALGIAKPWYVRGVDFDAARKVLTIGIDFVVGSRFAAPEVEGVHRVHDTQTKRLRHLNFFQHECYLEVRTPRVKLPDGRVVQIEPDWFGKLSGFTLLFEALVLALAQQMTFAALGPVPEREAAEQDHHQTAGHHGREHPTPPQVIGDPAHADP